MGISAKESARRGNAREESRAATSLSGKRIGAALVRRGDHEIDRGRADQRRATTIRRMMSFRMSESVATIARRCRFCPTARSRCSHSTPCARRSRLRRAWRAAAHRERTLRIGVDIRPFYEPLTGVGWYLYYLLHELAKHDDVELVLFGDARVTDLGPSLHADLPANAQLCTFDLRGRPLSRRFDRPLTAGGVRGLDRARRLRRLLRRELLSAAPALGAWRAGA